MIGQRSDRGVWMRVAIVGAGFAGLGTARMLLRSGFDVTVFDRAPDLGGVWSRTRRYPGLRTQNDKGTYAFSELPMPRHYPEWPEGEQVQRYLESYAAIFGLGPAIRLNTEVVSAELTTHSPGVVSWTLTVRPLVNPESTQTLTFDHLVVANGTFSEPVVPVFPGRTDFTAAGGRICAPSDFRRIEDARDRDVLVVGYGKSACDLAVPVSEVATSTTVVARRLLWKVPRRIGGALNYKYLLLTRLGEGLFPYLRPRRSDRLLHGPGARVSRAMLKGLQNTVVRQFRLDRLGLVPRGDFREIARSTVSLATEGFYERIRDGRLRVHRDAAIEELTVVDGRPHARLSNGHVLSADLIICGTGFAQQVPFLSPEVIADLQDDRGNFVLYRQILPPKVPALTFAGYNSSLFCPLGIEMSAVWTAAYLLDGLNLPSSQQMWARAGEQVRWMEQRTEGKHARGTSVVPFSLHVIDEVLADLRLDVSRAVRARQWLVPVDPSSYRDIGTALLKRHGLMSHSS
jgi:dimethylaniline monooxygenase (N-oxide forming)